jgi:hypothetical protein
VLQAWGLHSSVFHSLAGCTDEFSEDPGLMVNVPHSGACSTEDVRLGTERMDADSMSRRHMAP